MPVAVGIRTVGNPVPNLFAAENESHFIGYLLSFTSYKKDVLNMVPRALPSANVDHRQAEKRSLQQAEAGVSQQQRRAAQQIADKVRFILGSEEIRNRE